MDKIGKLKQTLISAYSDLVRDAQRGYPLEDYATIKNAMLAITMIQNTVVTDKKKDTIADYYLRKFNNL